MIHLPNLAPYHVKPGLDTLYTSGGYVLQELWSRELLMPHLACIDKKFSSSHHTVDEAKIIDRSIVRGAILHCIAEVYGMDAVFALLSLEPFLATPLVGTTIYDKTKAVACRTMCKMPMFFMKNLMRSRSHICVKDVCRLCVYYHIYMVAIPWNLERI